MGLAGTAKEPEDFRAGDVNIYEAQTGDGAPEIRLFPHVFERWKPSGEVIQAPDIDPGENGEKESDLESEEGKADPQQTGGPGGAASSGGGGRGGQDRDWLRSQGHANNSPCWGIG